MKAYMAELERKQRQVDAVEKARSLPKLTDAQVSRIAMLLSLSPVAEADEVAS